MLTLYGDTTPNVQKITIALEELELAYRKEKIDRLRDEHLSEHFLALSPNNKIPLITDDDISIWESGAILIYLCDRYDTGGALLAREGPSRYAALQCAFFQAASIGPNLGRLNSQLSASEENQIPQMLEIFYEEAVRLVGVLDRLFSDGRHYVAGTYSIADIMHYPWLKAGLDLGFPALTQNSRLTDWLGRLSERPSIQTGMRVGF